MAPSEKKISPRSGQFRPSKLEPPKISDSLEQYNVYVQNYLFYLDSLKGLKNSFWKSSKDEEPVFVKKEAFKIYSSKGILTYMEQDKPPSGYLSEKVSVLVVDKPAKAVVDVKPKPAKAEATELERAASLARRKASRRRQRKARAIRDAATSVSFSANLVKLASNNNALRKSKFTFGTVGVSTHSVLIQKTKGKARKGKETADGAPPSPKPPPSRPSGSNVKPKGETKPDPKGKGPEEDKKPSRRERREAIYGLPKSEPAEEAPATEVEEEYEPPLAKQFDMDRFALLEARSRPPIAPRWLASVTPKEELLDRLTEYKDPVNTPGVEYLGKTGSREVDPDYAETKAAFAGK